MKFSGVLFLFILLGSLSAQSIPGGSSGQSKEVKSFSTSMASFPQRQAVNGNYVFSTTTYTFSDLVVFSYFDDSFFLLYNQDGAVIDSAALNKDEFHVFKPASGTGIYSIEGTKSFTLLIGDPVTNTVMGFFAVDESGSPLSTKLNTFMPANDWGGEHFVVFAYNDNTEYTITNLTDTSTVAAGILNRGEHVTLDNQFSKFLKVQSNKPVSALSYADQGYYIPADNGTFTGTHFYGFSGYIGGWPNGIVITAYSDQTDYVAVNTETGDTLGQGTINIGDAASIPVFSDTYFEVITSNKATVNNTPFAYYSGAYYHLTRQIDESGRGIGTHFLIPVIPGDFDLFSFADNNDVVIVDMWSGDTVYTEVLNQGEHYHFSPVKTVYQVNGSENLSIITSYGGGYGADFVPLNFATGLPDLSISASDIVFDPDTDNRSVNDPITIFATVHNFGFETAYNVPVQFFDGDPSGGISISQVMYVDSIPSQASYTFQFSWNVPEFPAYHAVHVLIDGKETILESNSSNNSAFKFIVANTDLLPPLSTVIEAPARVYFDGDSAEFNTFTISVSVFNTGTVIADSSVAILHLPAGLELVEGDSAAILGDIDANSNAKFSWPVSIVSFPDEDAFFFSIEVEALNAENKVVKRMLLINRPTAIETPSHMSGIPENFSLRNNYPNPFNPETTIEFNLAESGKVLLEVYDINGRKVSTLINNTLSAGMYKTKFNAENLVSGVYFIRYNFNGQNIDIKKMTLLK